MTLLRRKLRRDLWHLRGQVFAISMVVACGVAAVATSRTIYVSLAAAVDDYYAEYRFADVFARLERAPQRVADEIARTPGVSEVRTRIVFEVTLDVPGLADPATGRLVSMPAHHRPVLNDLHLRRGRYVSPGGRGEVIVSEAFADANRLAIGDRFGAILNGRWAELRVVGIALSPEYIYEIRGTDVFPDNRRFGVMWMSRDVLGPAFDMEGAFNDVALSLSASTSEAEVIDRLDDLLEPYGGLGAHGREDHISHRFITDEIKQNRVFGTIMPAIFLGVAAFLLNIVLTRLVATQRDQIGVLKAFGYGHLPIALHFLEMAFAALALGVVVGTVAGVWLSERIEGVYADFYRFPELDFRTEPSVVVIATAVSAVAALLGAMGALSRVWRLPPAEAMRAEPPARFRGGLLDRAGLSRVLGTSSRMIARNLSRRPLRALLSVLGIAMGIAIVVLGRFFIDAMQHMAEVQFRIVQREDVMVVAHEPLPERAEHELRQLPGVIESEPFRIVPVRLRHGHREQRTALMGLPHGHGLRRLVERDLSQVELPPEGVLLTTKLAEMLDVRPGEMLRAEALEGSRPVRPLRVSGTVDELIGISAYMDVDALNRFMREGGTRSGALLRVDAHRQGRLYRTLKRLPAIGGVSQRKAMLRGFEETLQRSMSVFTTILVGFASVIAIAVVYNSARIALSERGRELASLRVLGFTHREVTSMLLGEQALLTLLAFPPGFAIGYGLSWLLASAYQWELFRLPLVISTDTYVFATAVILGASLGSAWLIRRRLARLDLVAVLKSRE